MHNQEMPTLVEDTLIHAPVQVVFDAARDITLHCQTARHTHERAVAGVRHGKVQLNDEVTFEAVHLGVRQRLSSCISEFEPPHYFVDEMIRGAFKTLWHRHEFEARDQSTLMRDTIIWTSPFGPVGVLFDRLILIRHMQNFLRVRNRELKHLVEAEYASAKVL
jgi:ligand-binding SRPBCC domain-containing protein